jgi:hypothetical protein
MPIDSRRSALSLMASAALLMGACGTTEPTVSPRPSAGTFQPTYADIACPEDVEV